MLPKYGIEASEKGTSIMAAPGAPSGRCRTTVMGGEVLEMVRGLNLKESSESACLSFCLMMFDDYSPMKHIIYLFFWRRGL